MDKNFFLEMPGFFKSKKPEGSRLFRVFNCLLKVKLNCLVRRYSLVDVVSFFVVSVEVVSFLVVSCKLTSLVDE